MKVDVKKIDNSKVKISVELPKILVDSYFQTAAKELSKDLKVKGFRPGKVPVDIVEKELGSQRLYNQVANLAIQRTLPGIILDNKLEVVGRPEIVIKKIAKGNSLIYQAIFQLIPQVELASYKGLKVKRNKPKVEEEEIKKSLDYLRNSRAKITTVSRSAKKGDRVEIDFEVRQGGVKIENGESKNHPLVLGQSRFLPGFEKELEGMKAGEEKEFSSKVPTNWPDKKIAGKILDFKVKMNLVQERETPVLDDQFAKSLGNFESLANLKNSIKEGILEEKELKEKQRIRIELIEKVAQDSKIETPDVLIEEEIEKMLNEFRTTVSNMGLNFERYLKEIKKTEEDLKKDWRGQAEKRVRIALCLRAIAKKENIEASEEEVEERINKDLKQYPNIGEAEKNIDLSALKDYTRNILRNEKVFDFLEREAKIVRSE